MVGLPFKEINYLTESRIIWLWCCSVLHLPFIYYMFVLVFPSRVPKSQWRSDQAHVWVPGDHPFRAGETDDEDVPQGGEEREEERQRNRWQRHLRCCHALWPQRDESPAVYHSQNFLLNFPSVLFSSLVFVCPSPSVLFGLGTKTASFCIFHDILAGALQNKKSTVTQHLVISFL